VCVCVGVGVEGWKLFEGKERKRERKKERGEEGWGWVGLNEGIEKKEDFT